MKCPIDSGQPGILLDYAAGRLPAPHACVLEEHFEICGECREFAAVQKNVWAALDGWEMAAISPDFNRRLYARIEREEARRSWVSGWWQAIGARWLHPLDWRPVMPAVAALAVLVLALALDSPSRYSPDESDPVATAAEKIDIEQVERALDDVEMLKELGSVTTPGS